MTRRYFSQKEINKVKNGMKITYYEEYYKPSTRHGIPTAIIIVVSNVETIEKKKYKKNKYYYGTKDCPYCKRNYNALYLKLHIKKYCKALR